MKNLTLFLILFFLSTLAQANYTEHKVKQMNKFADLISEARSQGQISKQECSLEVLELTKMRERAIDVISISIDDFLVKTDQIISSVNCDY